MSRARLYLLLFGLPLVLMPAMGAVFSGGDPKIVLFFAEAGAVSVAAIALISLPLVYLANGGRRSALEKVAAAVGGRVVGTVDGDCRLELDEAEGGVTVLFWTDTQETAGDEERKPWTCVGRVRPGRGAPAVEVRFEPGKLPVVRWANRWWDELGRGAPSDPLTPDGRLAAETLASVFPEHETRVRFDGDVAAFAIPGHARDPQALATLLLAVRPLVGRL